MLEEGDNLIKNSNQGNNSIVQIEANINGIEAILLIDTGSNVSLIDSIELERIKQNSNLPIPTLPINNVILVGATGRQNKSIKKQVSLEMTSNGVTIPIGLLVASNLPMSILTVSYTHLDVYKRQVCKHKQHVL